MNERVVYPEGLKRGDLPADEPDAKAYGLVRYGKASRVAWFESSVPVRRAHRVVVRAPEGLFLGQVLNESKAVPRQVGGQILRRAGSEDEFLAARLAARHETAIAACETYLRSIQSPCVLVDAEYTLDAKTLLLYFLGDDAPDADLLDRLADLYGEAVGLAELARRIDDGCGPGCGSGDGACGRDACGVCVIAHVCRQTESH